MTIICTMIGCNILDEEMRKVPLVGKKRVIYIYRKTENSHV